MGAYILSHANIRLTQTLLLLEKSWNVGEFVTQLRRIWQLQYKVWVKFGSAYKIAA